MKRARVYTIIFIAVMIGVVSFDLFLHGKLHEELSKSSAKIKAKALKAEVAETQKLDQPEPVAVKIESSVLPGFEGIYISEEFKQELTMELDEVGRPQSNLEEIENRLSSFARHLEPNEISYLSLVIQHSETTGDLRALALDLLGRNQSSAALKGLKDFAVQTDRGFNPQPTQARRELEAMQAMAIENIASARTSLEALNYLQEIKNSTSNSFLKDRTERSILAFKGQVPTTESQDQKALEDILEE